MGVEKEEEEEEEEEQEGYIFQPFTAVRELKRSLISYYYFLCFYMFYLLSFLT